MKKLWRTLALALLFSSLGLIVVVWRVDVPRYWWLPLPALLAAVTTLALSWALAGWRLRLLVQRHQLELAWHQAVRIHLLGMFSATVTPGGSGATPAIALALHQHGLSQSRAWASALAIFSIDSVFFVWSLPLALALLHFSGQFLGQSANATRWNLLAIAAMLICALIAYILIFRLRCLLGFSKMCLVGRLARYRRPVWRFLLRFIRANDSFRQAPLAWHLYVQMLTACSWAAFFAVLYPLLLGAGIGLPWAWLEVWQLEAWQLVIMVISMVIPTPGASGYFEIATAALLKGRGNDALIATVIFWWRMLTFYLNFSFAFIFAGYLIPSKDKEEVHV